MRSAGCAANDVADRDFDRHVKRTANRPVTSGAVGVAEALTLGAALALRRVRARPHDQPRRGRVERRRARGDARLSVQQALLRDAAGGPRHRLQLRHPDGVRRGARRRFVVADALAGAVPPLAWWLLFGNLFWVLAYDTEYAMVDRDDDLRIGIKTSAITLGRFDVAAVMAFYAAFLAIWAVIGSAPRLRLAVLRRDRGRGADRLLALHADPRRARAKGAFAPFASTTGSASRSSPASSRSTRCADAGAAASARASLERGQRRGERAPTARSMCSLSTISGGAKRTTVPCVSLLSTPRASRPSQTCARARERRVDLDADQQALAAHLGDRRMVDRAQLGEQLVAANARLLGQPLALAAGRARPRRPRRRARCRRRCCRGRRA